MENVLSWWQQLPMKISPVIFDLGFAQIRWYGLMYFMSFFVFYLMVIVRLRTERLNFTEEKFEGFMTYAILGAVIGARFGYALFYNFDHFLANPLGVFWPYQKVGDEVVFGISGLSYHGGLLGVAAAIMIFAKRRNIGVLEFTDIIIPAIPLGYMFGRLGNFLNSELWGRVTTVPWGMNFPTAPGMDLRHPSQLYEAFGEGLLLFIILWAIRKRSPFQGFLFSIYLVGYGAVRFIIEFYRAPDEHLGTLALSLTMGQWLCVAMVAAGCGLFLYLKLKHESDICRNTKST